VTIGQYLQPSAQHLHLDRWVTPEQFADYREHGRRWASPTSRPVRWCAPATTPGTRPATLATIWHAADAPHQPQG
jgi:hypothetical protein